MSVVPYDMVASNEELIKVWFVYGQQGVRDGFRVAAPNVPPVMGNVTEKVCQTNDRKNAEWKLKCSPFRMDYYTAPLWFDYRSEDTSDLPPR